MSAPFDAHTIAVADQLFAEMMDRAMRLSKTNARLVGKTYTADDLLILEAGCAAGIGMGLRVLAERGLLQGKEA